MHRSNDIVEKLSPGQNDRYLVGGAEKRCDKLRRPRRYTNEVASPALALTTPSTPRGPAKGIRIEIDCNKKPGGLATG